jgi:hypothetical protein
MAEKSEWRFNSALAAIRNHKRRPFCASKTMRYRSQVSTVDAACRIVGANPAVAIVPREGAGALQQALKLKIIPLSNAWAQRRFVVCVRDPAALTVPARLILESLCGRRQRGVGRAKGGHEEADETH